MYVCVSNSESVNYGFIFSIEIGIYSSTGIVFYSVLFGVKFSPARMPFTVRVRVCYRSKYVTLFCNWGCRWGGRTECFAICFPRFPGCFRESKWPKFDFFIFSITRREHFFPRTLRDVGRIFAYSRWPLGDRAISRRFVFATHGIGAFPAHGFGRSVVRSSNPGPVVGPRDLTPSSDRMTRETASGRSESF